MGTPDFAVPSLEILLANKYPVRAVVTAPDKPRGRGQEFSPTPIKTVALKFQLPVLQPESLKESAFAANIKELNKKFQIPKVNMFDNVFHYHNIHYRHFPYCRYIVARQPRA